MEVCYDLDTSPPTYEFVSFLLWAEQERLRRIRNTIQVVFVPGRKAGFRDDKLWPYKERQKIFDNLVLPMAQLLPSCNAAEVKSRAVARVRNIIGLERRHYGLPVYVANLGNRPLRLRNGPKKRNDLVTITLRECEHWPERNSNIEEWHKAAHYIGGLGYEVKVIRDSLYSDIGLIARAGLYQSAFCNLFISNGPGWLSFAMNAPTLMLRPTIKHKLACFGEDWLAQCGIPKGGQLPDCPVHQRLVWEDDTAENIIAAFEDHVGRCKTRRPH